MEYALGLLIVLAVLLLPVGLALQWLALGAAARVQALPLALPTGLAAAVVVLAALAVGLFYLFAAAERWLAPQRPRRPAP